MFESPRISRQLRELKAKLFSAESRLATQLQRVKKLAELAKPDHAECDALRLQIQETRKATAAQAEIAARLQAAVLARSGAKADKIIADLESRGVELAPQAREYYRTRPDELSAYSKSIPAGPHTARKATAAKLLEQLQSGDLTALEQFVSQPDLYKKVRDENPIPRFREEQ